MKFSVLACAVLLVACTESRNHAANRPVDAKDSGACQDADGDGYGEGCELGGDCNDGDDAIHVGCSQCVTPQDGCRCTEPANPVSCYLAPSADDAGTMMCHEGTRYCREGHWSACESIVSYPKPIATQSQAIIAADAGPSRCNDCKINCFVVRDNLDPTDAGLDGTASSTQTTDGGGIGLTYTLSDAGTAQDAGTFDPSTCMLGAAPDRDCDGIPDIYDPYPDAKPFATANPTIFLDIAPGETGTGVINLQFYLNSADVYFLVDQTGSMQGERDQLVADLVGGDFINNAAYNCADYDFDFKPNNELKTQGIVGAIRCIIRDANFGVGYFREIPFYNSAQTFYAYSDNITYRHIQDITSDLTLLPPAVAKLIPISNIDWPEASMVALNAVVTGNGMYMGVDRPGLPTRGGCPSLAWGYPCFRPKAIPIVLMFTDAPFHNGPAHPLGPAIPYDPYDTTYTGITQGSTASYQTITPTNETFTLAADLGDLTSKVYSYIGTTNTMTSDLPYSASSCSQAGSQDSPDAFFKFSLTANKTVNITTLGSDFDTTLSLYRSTSSSATNLASYSNTNDNGVAPYAFGAAANKFVKASGNSSSLNSDFSANDLTCNTAPGAKDATFTFTLAASTKVALDTSGSSYGTVVGVFSGTPTTTTYVPVVDTNDTLATAYSAGTLNSKNLGFKGDTSVGTISANYLNSQLACSAAPADSSPDSVYSFSLTSATRVRVSAEDSPLNTVLMLTDNNSQYLQPYAVPNNNHDLEASALNLGAMDGKAYMVLGGDTTGQGADYASTVVNCNSNSAAKDGVYKFTLAGTKTIAIDTAGTSNYDTVLGLFKSTVASPETYVTLTNKNHERGDVAYNIGTVNGMKYVITGGSTTGMTADYLNTQTSISGSGTCGATTNNSTSPDAVFKFHLNSSTAVRIDTNTTGSSYFDTLLSLHNGPLPDLQVTSLTTNGNNNTNEDGGSSAYPVTSSNLFANLRFDGDTTNMGVQVPVDNTLGCSGVGRDAVYKLNVATAGNYEINTVGSASTFDTVLGVYPSTIYNPVAPTPVNQGILGDTKLLPIDITAMEGKWLTYTGDTTAMLINNSTTTFTGCNVASGSHDVYFKFSLTSTKTIVIDTTGMSAFNGTIGLFNWTGDAQLACNDGGAIGVADTITKSLGTGTYYVVLKGATSNSAQGAYRITFRDATTVSNTTNLLYCDNDSGGGLTSKVSQYLNAGTYYVVVKGRTATDRGTYSLAVKALDLIASANRIYCDDDGGSGSLSQIDQTLAAGDYWVVVKGHSNSKKGTYQLTVQDITTPPVNPEIACNDNASGSVTTSAISQSLTAGTYYVVVKGTSSTALGPYSLSIRDTAVTLVNNLACDASSGAGGKAFIEKDLAIGTYRVIVKGQNASDKGTYKIILRDVTQLPTKRLACDRNSGAGGKSYLETTLGSGTYTVVLSSDTNTSAGSGAYKLSLRDVVNFPTMDTVLSCNNDSGGATTSSLSAALTTGSYYVGVKGYTSSDVGTYQLNIGAGTTATSTYTPPTWTQTLAALTAKQVKVLPIISCHDDASSHGDSYHGVVGDCVTARSQAQELAKATNTLGSNLSPLVFDIDSDGGGLSKTVIDGVAALAHYLEMNVSAQVVFSPDANPGFTLVLKAVDSATDGCSGLVGNEHQHCVPGASPRFELAFTNPTAHPVPLNPADPNGGYNFRAELIGDNQFIVDKVPIYIIPRDVNPVPQPIPLVAPTGSYWQDVAAPGCSGNQRPDWHDLTWSADLPQGTTVSFNVCASDKSTDLKTCTLTTLATLTGGAGCFNDSQCANGFCSTAGNCNTITAGACTTDTQCLSGSHCKANKCTFDSQPVYIGGVLGAANHTANLRMNIGLTGNTMTNKSPTVHDWSITYLCDSVL